MRTPGRDGDHEIDANPITATILGFCKLSGLGRSKTYELLDAGEIESIHIGSRRLIIVDSYRRLLARLQATAAKTPRRQPPTGRLASAPKPPPRETTRAAAG